MEKWLKKDAQNEGGWRQMYLWMFLLGTLSVFIAVGPLTTSESDSYEPLIDFLNEVLKAEPDLVIMVTFAKIL